MAIQPGSPAGPAYARGLISRAFPLGGRSNSAFPGFTRAIRRLTVGYLGTEGICHAFGLASP